jgi:hypothetical protein
MSSGDTAALIVAGKSYNDAVAIQSALGGKADMMPASANVCF